MILRVQLSVVAVAMGFWASSPDARGDLVDPAPHVQQEVNWRVGQMRADPTLDLVYIVNETEDKILALNTGTGQVTASVTVGDAVREGHLEFSVDGTKLYLSTPYTNRLHTFSTGTLAFLGAVDLTFSVRSFVIGSDGFLYAVKDLTSYSDQLTKVNLTNGTEAGANVNLRWDPEGLFYRSASGSRIFYLIGGTAGPTSTVHELAVQTGAMTSYVSDHFPNSPAIQLAFDEPANTLFRSSGSYYGLGVWDIASRTADDMRFDARYVATMAFRSGAADIFGATSNSNDGVIRRYNKTTGALLHEYPYTGFTSGFSNGGILRDRLEVTANGHVVYGKEKAGSTGPSGFIGLLGHGSLNIPNAPPSSAPPQAEVQTNWSMGAMIGDPGRNFVYLVDDTNHKLMALDTATGQVTSELSLADDPAGGTLALSPDGNSLFLTTPDSSKLHRFTPGSSLSLLGSITLAVPAGGFVIGSDSHLYAAHDGDLKKIDPATGVVAGILASGTFQFFEDTIFRRNASGTRIFALERGASGGGGSVEEFAVVPGSIPTHEGTCYNTSVNDQDFSVDESRNSLYRTSGGIYGISVWHLDKEVENFWPYDSPYGTAVAQLPSRGTVFGASGSETIREFDKVTGKVVNTINHKNPDSGFFIGEIDTDHMEMAANGVVVYGKSDFPSNHYVGIIGLGILQLPRAGPTSPANVTATDGAHIDRVTVSWDAVPGATQYEIFRRTSDTFPLGPALATVTGTSWNDLGVAADTTYFYWVKAVNAVGKSQYSAPDSGNAGIPPPTGVSATDGTHPDRVRVTWNTVAEATGYKVYRSNNSDSGSASVVASFVTGATWDDTSSAPGTIYHYWVKAIYGGGESVFSSGDSGYTQDLPDSPAELSATDGAYNDRVSLSWNTATGAVTYKIYRGTSTNPAGATLRATGVVGGSWDDTAVTGGVTYHYWVKATNLVGDSEFSNRDSGYSLPDLGVPSGVNATDGDYLDKVRVTWSAAANAEEYHIYRKNLPSGIFLHWGTVGAGARTYDDTRAATGRQYRYRVTAHSATGGESVPSAADDGFTGLPLPANVTATDGMHQGEVRLTWDDASGITEYEIHRGTLEDGSDASPIGTTNATEYADTSGNAGESYFYFVKSKAGTIASEIGTGDQGHGTVGPPFRPDGLIGKKTASMKGDDLYVPGKAQELKLISKRLRKLTWHIEVQNDGETADRLMCRMNRTNRWFKPVLRLPNGNNVMGQAVTGRLPANLDGGGSSNYKLEIKPSRAAKGKVKRKTFLFWLKSVTDTSLTDRVSARAETKR